MKGDDMNNPIVINFDTHDGWTDDHFILEEVEAKRVEGGKYLVTCRPLDVRLGRGFLFPSGHEELKKRYEKLIERGNRLHLTGGIHRDIFIYTPDNPENYPDGFKNTFPGLFMSMASAIQKDQNALREIIDAKNLTDKQIMQMEMSGEINDWVLQRQQKNIQSIVNIVSEEVKKEISGRKETSESKSPSEKKSDTS